ncbi:MAG TPA: DNA alkylation repair protein [Candidatus Limnocylindrales bacterium]|nr:DNA alkylation repair protein [Candidatus Limnocylindrales bacterium]
MSTVGDRAGIAPVAETTERARVFVAAHKPEAAALGRDAGELVHDPADLVDTLRAGLEPLADPEYLEGMQRVAPGIGPILGVRQPLLRAVAQGLRAATRRDRPDTVLDVADHLLRGDLLELHWIAFTLLERTIALEPERTWQLVRGSARRADNWITVDSLAHVAARGILAEAYRWAELEQLVYSPSRWERRLVGSTIAVIPVTDRTAGRTPDVARHGLGLIRDAIGDDEPDVQKALSWALRSLTVVDRDATVAFLREEAAAARATGDGNRAWVVRDSLEKLPAPLASELKAAVDGIRRRPNATSTSRAAATAAAFLGLGVDVPPAERPVVERP